MSRILVISPHPDDESIGCGGTLRDHVISGDSVRVVFLTSGEAGSHGRTQAETTRQREEEARTAAAILGIEQVDFWRQPDGALRATRALIVRLRELLAIWRPELIYVTHEREDHSDHRAAARLVRGALSGMKDSLAKPYVRMFEIWTPLQKIDDIVDISAYVETKKAAIRAHQSQCEVIRFDEAALSLNRYRGKLFNWPNNGSAEVFQRMQL